MDWALLAIGLLTFLFSFIAFYHESQSGPGIPSSSSNASAWHDVFGGGFFGWFAMLLAVIGAVVLALDLFAPQVKLPGSVPARLLVLYAFAAAALFELLAIFIHPKFGSIALGAFKASVGHGFGFWISLILILAGAALAFLRLKATGGKLPWEKSGGNTNPPQQWQGGQPQQ